MYHILICDDEQDIVNALKIYLSNPDFKLFEANTGVQALEVMEREDIHLILLDIMMPEMDGISAMVKIREQSNVPIILLTAKSEDTDKILGLNTGADDYITKPFNPVEVTARVRSQLRRYMQLGSRTAAPARYVIGGVELDDSSKEVTLDGEPISLTPIEYDILKLLKRFKGAWKKKKRVVALTAVIATILALCIRYGIFDHFAYREEIAVNGAVYARSRETVSEIPDGSVELGYLRSILHRNIGSPSVDFSGTNLDEKYGGCGLYQDPENEMVVYLEDYGGFYIPFVLKEYIVQPETS